MQNLLMDGLSTAVIGLLVVFLGLILLIAIISLMRVFSVQKKEAHVKAVPVAPPAAAPVAQPQAADQSAVVAAITAAIAMMMQQEGKTEGFVVRRIRRVGTHR